MKTIDQKINEVIKKEFESKKINDKKLLKLIEEIENINRLSNDKSNNFPLRDTIGKRISFNTYK